MKLILHNIVHVNYFSIVTFNLEPSAMCIQWSVIDHTEGTVVRNKMPQTYKHQIVSFFVEYIKSINKCYNNMNILIKLHWRYIDISLISKMLLK